MNSIMTQYFSRWILLLMFSLSGCGGGGGGAAPGGSAPPVFPQALAVAAASFENKNNTDASLNTTQITEITTSSPLGKSISESLAMADFFQEASYSAFVAVSQAGAASKAYFLKKNASGSWVDSTSSLLSEADRTVCSKVVQALSADFNNDGKPDVYVACGGTSAVQQILFLSQASQSTYTRQETTGISIQSWGASAADIDGDGRIDIVSSDGNGVVQLTNNGVTNGILSWSKKTQAQMGITNLTDFPTMPRKVFLLPNSGGLPDLVVAGDGDQINNTMVWMKNQSGTFNFNGNSLVSRIADNYPMVDANAQPINATIFDLVISSSNLFVLVKNATVENASNATSMAILRYELPKDTPGTQLNLIASSPTVALPSANYQPTGGLVSQIKPNSSGQFVAYDADCVSTEQRCSFVVTP